MSRSLAPLRFTPPAPDVTETEKVRGRRIGTDNFIALAACLECLGGYLTVDPRFMNLMKAGDHIVSTILPDGSLELRLVHVEQEFHEAPPEVLALRKPMPRGLL